MPVINMTGQLVGLGPLQCEFIALYHRWENDLSTSRTLGLSWPTTIGQAEAAYQQRVNSTDAIHFTIFDCSTMKPVGLSYLYDIDHRHRRASFGITIGEPQARGKGLGTEATRLMLDYAFNALGLSNVMLTVYEFNAAGLRAYAKAGFREFGRRRKCSRQGDQLWDLVYMECLATEFRSLQLRARFLPANTGP